MMMILTSSQFLESNLIKQKKVLSGMTKFQRKKGYVLNNFLIFLTINFRDIKKTLLIIR